MLDEIRKDTRKKVWEIGPVEYSTMTYFSWPGIETATCRTKFQFGSWSIVFLFESTMTVFPSSGIPKLDVGRSLVKMIQTL